MLNKSDKMKAWEQASDAYNSARDALQAAKLDSEKMSSLRKEWDAEKNGPLFCNFSDTAIDYENKGAGISNYRLAYEKISHVGEGVQRRGRFRSIAKTSIKSLSTSNRIVQKKTNFAHERRLRCCP